MGVDDGKLVRVALYLTREQRRWLKQRAVATDSNASEVARGILNREFNVQLTTATVDPTPLGVGPEEAAP